MAYVPEYDIVIAMSRAKAVEILRDALAAAEAAEGDGDLDFAIHGLPNGITNPRVTMATISNDDMERPEVADDIFFDVRQI